MKLTFVIFVLLPLAVLALPSTDEETSSERIKRSGGLSFLQTIQKSLFGASAQLSAGSSGSSSSSGHDFPDSPHDTKGFDGWQLKKSILNTLFQAVKAITGGVTTLGGQLIKGSGYAVSAKGKLIAAGGDAVSGAGQKIINSAHLIPPSGHAGYGHSAGGGSAAFFAKLSGASGSAIAGLSSGSSGSSSGTTHDSHESFTSYGGPSGSGFAPGSVSYSEIKTPDYIVSSKPSYTPIKTYDIPKSPSTSYGPSPFEDYHYSRHPEDASIVLQEILKTLPEKPSKTIKSQSYHNVKQYEIPSDPIPPFKPLKSHSAHSVYGVPAEATISHTHTLTTSYGSPAVDQYHKYFEHRSDSSEPVPSVVPNYRDAANSHSIWHKMTLKKTKPITSNDTKVTTSNDLTKTADDSLSQNNELHKTLIGQALGKNTDFTIEKSIQYEIKESDYKKP